MKYPSNRRLAKSIGRKLPVRKTEQIHKSPKDYDRRNNEKAIEEGLKEEEMEKDNAWANIVASKIADVMAADGVHAVRTETKPDEAPVVTVYGLRRNLRITIDTE